MILTACCALSEDGIAQCRDINRNTQEKYISIDAITETYTTTRGYGCKTVVGKLKEGIDINELELSMLVDNGFWYFGGTSIIYPDKSFCVTVYID